MGCFGGALYDFRHRLQLPHSYLPYAEEETTLRVPGFEDNRTVRASREPASALKDSTSAVLLGAKFTSSEEAQRAGIATRTLLERAFAVAGVAADFGDRATKSQLTEAGRELIKQGQKIRVLDESPNLMVYPHSDMPTRFSGFSVDGYAPAVAEPLNTALSHADAGAAGKSEALSLAFDLYSKSKFPGSCDVSFLLRMMAVEALIDQQPRTAPEQTVVKAAIDSAKAADREIPKEDYDSLLGSRQHLLNESIGLSGRKLVDTLGERRYAGKTAREFFKQCYRVRSQLVHGETPRPSQEEVRLLNAHLDHLVRQLIAGPDLVEAVLGSPADRDSGSDPRSQKIDES